MNALPRPVSVFETFSRLNVNSRGIASLAAQSLLQELETWPKPGLVSHVDSGSHRDMDAETFRYSASAIEPYFRSLVIAGAGARQMTHLRSIGIAAETAMLSATGGINTHRGAIFGIGLLCAAAGARANGVVDFGFPLGSTVHELWGQSILAGPRLADSHGAQANLRYGVGGARSEAANGFPSIYNIGLPALRASRLKLPNDPEAQRVETCFALIAALDDTNLLHRGGQQGLLYAQQAARLFLARGGIAAACWRLQAQSIHEEFIARSLSPGGAADLLAMTLFVDEIEGT
ncbi:triphosphoribosyl-dephospho-CoA synthase MdcB [Phyllobacterium chamaecytisi]|uniref:triphosphoribosyl-dephospho-CoA synthase MdcB n=1 Tax=Phyllobacterium chamaecytisi TaxID=2876082 RepID=UPI001CC9C5D2|nr:triphosphoribosyl-dephospho-CoA synthase MdcB [Phyllobacterium sp. KW56]MBZ9601387.1 triphosphoribosyl-dephospho-CoA synthase MdcB [Phyllobacterium sp. KW56]